MNVLLIISSTGEQSLKNEFFFGSSEQARIFEGMKVLLICLVALGSFVIAAEGRKRPYESAKRWESSLTIAVRLSCLNQRYANELTCRCAWNAGLVPASIGGTRPGCTEEFACNKLGGTNCNACGESRKNELTCRGLVAARDLRRGYAIVVICLFALLLTFGVVFRAFSRRHCLRESKSAQKGSSIDLFEMQQPEQLGPEASVQQPEQPEAMQQPEQSKASPVDVAFMRAIENWQWTFWPLFMLPCIAVLGALLSIISLAEPERDFDFWKNWVQMPRWDHHTDSVQMPDGDWEEDFCFPAVSNLPEMYIKYSSQARDEWIFDNKTSSYFFLTSEFFFLFMALAAVFVFPAVHTLVAYCRVVIHPKPRSWPNLYYLFAICLLGGIIGIANIQGAYGRRQTDAHFGLSIVFFVFSFLTEILVIMSVGSMNLHWASRFRKSLFAAVMSFSFRTVYVIMYFISDAYPDNHDAHLNIYSTQNFLTWLFTWCQMWMIQSLPICYVDADKLRVQAKLLLSRPPRKNTSHASEPIEVPTGASVDRSTLLIDPPKAKDSADLAFIPDWVRFAGPYVSSPSVPPSAGLEETASAFHKPLMIDNGPPVMMIDNGPPDQHNNETSVTAPIQDASDSEGVWTRRTFGDNIFLNAEEQYLPAYLAEGLAAPPPASAVDSKSDPIELGAVEVCFSAKPPVLKS